MRILRGLLIAFAAAPMLPAVLLGCEHPAGGAADLLEAAARPIPLGRFGHPLHQEVGTPNRSAQLYYDQGLSFFSGYAFLDAARSFREALRLEPGLAMAWAGLGRSLRQLEAPAAAAEAMAAAARLLAAGGLPPADAQHVELALLEFRLFADGEATPDEREAFRAAIDAALGRRGRDPYLHLLRGHAEGPEPDRAGRTAGAKSTPHYARALELDPQLWAAHHFLAHSLENSFAFAAALEHSQAFAAAASELPHAWHMAAHVLPRLGRWKEALDLLEKAQRLHLELAPAPAEQGADWHFAHNTRLLATLSLLLGKKTAEGHFRTVRELAFGDWRDAYYCQAWGHFLLAGARFTEAQSAGERCAARPGLGAEALGRLLAGEAQLAGGLFADAERQLAAARRAAEPLSPGGVMPHTPRLLQGEIRRALAVLELLLERQRRALDDAAAFARLERLYAPASGFDGWSDRLFAYRRLAAVSRACGFAGLAAALDQAAQIPASPVEKN